MKGSPISKQGARSWEPVYEIFQQWVKNKEKDLHPALKAQPTIKVLIFLTLLETPKACTYNDIREILSIKGVIKGEIPDNTLRTSILNLSKALDKYKHSLELKSFRGKFQLTLRQNRGINIFTKSNQIILIQEQPTIKAESIAQELVEKARLPFHALYFLEWSARWWEIFSHNESQIRVKYEVEAWKKLGIQDRLLANSNDILSFVALAPGEGIAEIELLKNILQLNPCKTIHYVAIDSSQRLLREHINLLKESLSNDINMGRLICVGTNADIFNELSQTIRKVRQELVNKSLIKYPDDFLPNSSSLLVTYLGNCLGNYYQDQEAEIFSIIYSTFPNRPLECLIGVSVMREHPDEYSRNWDDFLLQTPKHLLETNKLLLSSKNPNCEEPDEFTLSSLSDNERCPLVVPETYHARHGLEGQIYRFYYKLQYDLHLISSDEKFLPKGSLILLYNIIKYNLQTLIKSLEANGLFKLNYDPNYHQIIDTPNGIREYAVFTAFLN